MLRLTIDVDLVSLLAVLAAIKTIYLQ